MNKATKKVLTSDAFWAGYDTQDKFLNFMQHDFDHPSRKIAHNILSEEIMKFGDNVPIFCEVGFGGCYDFRTRFKDWEDNGLIKYVGFDHTQEFVNHAKNIFPSYDFRQGDFIDLPEGAFDIVYTRHVLQHAAPEVYQDWIRSLLNATRQTAIIVWRLPPADEHIVWNDGWNNRWDKDVVHAVIKGRGFSVKEVPVNEEDCVYILKKNEP